VTKACVNYDAIMRWLEFKKKVNSHDLSDIEWVRDDGSTITFDPKLIEEWKFMGMTNVSFVELFLTRVVEGQEKELLKELDTWETVGGDK
jgi:hypothetical protein